MEPWEIQAVPWVELWQVLWQVDLQDQEWVMLWVTWVVRVEPWEIQEAL